jgi:peptide/nickel transport system substrate-binding protein
MKKLLFITLAFILISGLIFSGCAQSAPATSPAAAKTTTAPAVSTANPPATGPQYGGTLRIISTPGITSLGNPGKMTFAGEQILERPAIQYLLSRDPKTMNYVGELASSYEVTPTYNALILHLRQGVKFHDGTDFNAEAVKYNLELVQKGYRAADLQSVTSIETPDNYTVRLNLSKFEYSLQDNLCSMSGGIVSPTYLQSLTNPQNFKPVGTGPYKFVGYQPDVSLKFERFDSYWGGKPYLDKLEWNFIADPVTQLASFKAGEADVVRQLDVVSALDLQSSNKYNIVKYPQQIWGIAGDGAHSNSVYSNLKVRQALAYALDTEAIAKAVGKGLFASTNQWDKKEGLYYDSSIKGYPYNPQKAKDLLAEAGYPNGFSTKITLPSAVPTPDMMTMVQSYLNAVGIKATLDVIDPTRFNTFAAKDGWNNQLTFFWIASGNGVVDGFKSKMTSLSTGFDTKSLLIPADYNAKYLQAALENDPAKRVPAYREVLRMATDTYCISVPILVNYYFKATSQNVHNCDMLDYGINEWRPENAWLSK